METNPGRWERIQNLFHAALELPEAERVDYLAAQCADDPRLAAEVQALLDADAAGALPEPDLGQLAQQVLDGSVPVLRRIGPYRIVRVLGHGGMGVVYLGERDDLNSRVAIKVLRDAALSAARRERFEREEQTLAQLNHPAIARLYDADVLPDGTPYFVMEYVEGVPLNAYCATHSCSIGERLRLFHNVCEAVQYAHRHAVVHRDLKPSNILVAEAGPGGEATVKLLDFGIAKQLESLDTPVHQTRTGLRLMTPAYAAPEQLRGEPIGVHTDVYALGVILYELLTGRHPFDSSGLTPGQLEARILESGPARPSASARRTPESPSAAPTFPLSRAAWADLDVLCLTAMHPDAQRRYPTVEALLRDLQHFLAGQPLDARADTFRYRAGKFVRRNREPVAVAGMVAALLVGLITFYTAQLTEQRDRAQLEAEKAAQVSEYLISLFEAGDPYGPEAEDLNLRALLERGEQRAEELAGQPVVKAAMLNVLGRVYTQLSDFDRAEPLLRRALELRREHGDPLDIAESLSSLASLLIDTGDYGGAEAALRDALALRERHLPPNHPDLATNLASLGSVLNYRGEHADAEAIHRLALRIRRAVHQRPHEDLGASLNGLAVALYHQGKYAAAEHTYREALAVNRAVFGSEHASVTRVMANFGKLYEELGDYAAADSLLSEALRIRRTTLGNDHFETAVGLSQLAGLYNAMGEHERAELYFRKALAIHERILAPNHPSIATTINNLANTLELRGEYEDAEAFYRRAAAIYRESLGERHRFAGIALCNVGHVLYLMSQLDGAYTDLRECLSILEEVHPDDHPQLAHNRIRLGEVLVARGRHAEAEPLLLQGYRTLRAQLGPEHARTRAAAQRLVTLYEAWGRPENAVPYLLTVADEGTGSTP